MQIRFGRMFATDVFIGNIFISDLQNYLLAVPRRVLQISYFELLAAFRVEIHLISSLYHQSTPDAWSNGFVFPNRL